MEGARARTGIRKNQSSSFDRLRAIDGRHPFQERCPGSYVAYQVRTRKNASVLYFNFNLAKEMGIIPEEHPHAVTPELEAALIDTFSIQIINEYDIIHNTKIPADEIKPHRYMATRYLQLQHPSKTGLTSGDGRSLWNGTTTYRGKTWDITSCGTGATCLSPATALQKKFFRTGDPSVSYGCGYNDLHDGISNAVFSEILHLNDIRTERTLLVLSYPGDLCITVRAGENLLRPSHFFNHLRQGRLDRLKAAVDFFIDRQIQNGDWQKNTKQNRYDALMEFACKTFAHMAAKFESEYIFCWLDWDGDNILMDGGIIDYGSIRQFGLFHHEYRYDDTDRWSTSIKEQRNKARHILRTIVQMCDYLKTGTRKSLEAFDDHVILKKFDYLLQEEAKTMLLMRTGFTPEQAKWLVGNRKTDVEGFRRMYRYFETAKSSKGTKRTADGVTCDALFCMRDILREIPTLYLAGFDPIAPKVFMSIIKSNYATRKEARVTPPRARKQERLQTHYRRLVSSIASKEEATREEILRQMQSRSSVINRYERITGNAILEIGRRIMAARKRLTSKQLHSLLTGFIHEQILVPDKRTQISKRSITARTSKTGRLSHVILRIVRDYREGI